MEVEMLGFEFGFAQQFRDHGHASDARRPSPSRPMRCAIEPRHRLQQGCFVIPLRQTSPRRGRQGRPAAGCVPTCALTRATGVRSVIPNLERRGKRPGQKHRRSDLALGGPALSSLVEIPDRGQRPRSVGEARRCAPTEMRVPAAGKAVGLQLPRWRHRCDSGRVAGILPVRG